MSGRMGAILETVKLPHMLFALPFAVVGAFWAAGGLPGGAEIALVLVAMVSAHVAGMAFNRVVDARLDAANPRTRDRAIPSGRLSRRAVAGLSLAGAAGFVAAAAAFWPLSGTAWPVVLALPFLAVLCGYSYTKRFTSLSHYVLGLALGLAPVGAWIALAGGAAWQPVVLGGAVLFWAAGFDILYSLQDMNHDRSAGLRSIPSRLGAAGALRVARVNHALGVVLLAVPYVADGGQDMSGGVTLGPWYAAGVVVFGGLMVYEHALIRAGDLRRLDRAFFAVNASGSILFAGLAVVDVLAG